MWVSRKQLETMEKRVADLENQVQNRQSFKVKMRNIHDRTTYIGWWIIDMNENHWWFSPLVAGISSLVGCVIGIRLFSLILSMLQR